jgi:hypothetical protein
MNTSPPPPTPSASPSAITTLRRALFTCAGIIFVSTAVLIAGQRLFFDLYESSHGGPIGKPGIYAVGMLFIPFLGLWALVNLVFSMRVCTARFSSWKMAAVLSLLTLLTFDNPASKPRTASRLCRCILAIPARRFPSWLAPKLAAKNRQKRQSHAIPFPV